MSEVLVETMMELLSSHRHLAELLEESIRRQDDLIYELRAAVEKNHSPLDTGLSSGRPGPSRPQPNQMVTASGPPCSQGIPEHCQICSRCGITAEDDAMDLPGHMEAEWSGYPLWDGYSSDGVRPRHQRAV